ncbi:MAG: hypothetical protein LBM61_00930, partial [Prevotellaceae bacterium]|nr:hypothetical protein [Prevotellaceae bacterium]
GARGSGTANAHYEPDRVVINLTKTRGAGSLAHEWWHALDNYFSRLGGERLGHLTEYRGTFISAAVREEIKRSFGSLTDAIAKSDFSKRSQNLDKKTGRNYWASKVEESARAFEGYVTDKLSETNRHNDYLANFNDYRTYMNENSIDLVDETYPYPLLNDAESINPAFDNLFSIIEERVNEETGSAVLFREDETDTPEQVNERFNDELQQQIDGTLPKGHIYRLGMPSEALLSRLTNLPIEMAASTLEVKSSRDYISNHPFDLKNIENLPNAIANPIAVFESDTNPNRTVVLTELTDKNGNNFIAVIDISRSRERNYNTINSIVSLYPKDSNIRIAKWFLGSNDSDIERDLLYWVDKKKALNWLSNNASDVRSVGLPFKSVANIVQNFENPKLSDENQSNVPEPDIRYLFIGEQGAKRLDESDIPVEYGQMIAGTRLLNLAYAKAAESDQIDPENIKYATGWERGADGKWRYEIPDIEIDMSVVDSTRTDKPVVVKLTDLAPARSEISRGGVRWTIGTEANTNLYKAFPELKKIKVELYRGSGNTFGEYSPAKRKIGLNIAYRGFVRETLIHEVQHAIQDIEGFVGGGSPEEIMKRMPSGSEYAYYEANLMYNNLSGEVEARNAARRRNMSAEERRDSLAKLTEDVARKDQLFLRNHLEDMPESSIFVNQKMPNSNEERTSTQLEELAGSDEQGERIREVLSRASGIAGRGNESATGEGQNTWSKERLLGQLEVDARQNGTWIEDIHSIVSKPLSRGNENEVYLSDDGKNVVKVNNLLLIDDEHRMDNFIDRLAAHNELFSDVPYRIIGFAENSVGEVGIVLEQPYLQDAVPATYNEIASFLRSQGFYRTDLSDDEVGWRNSDYELWDAEPKNVLRDGTGNLYFIDTVVNHRAAADTARDRTARSENIRTAAERLADSLHTPLRIVGDITELPEGSAARRRIQRGGNVKGWFDIPSGEVVLYLPNATTTEDARRTIFHEVVGHYGLRRLLGGEFDGFLDRVYRDANEDIRRDIIRRTNGNIVRLREATEEYIATLAERGFANEAEHTLWDKIKYALMEFLRRIGVRGFRLSDKELRYVLWKSYQNLTSPTLLDRAADIDMQNRLGVGNYQRGGVLHRAEINTDEINDRFNDELQQQIDGALPKGHVYRLGMPSDVLRSAGIPNLPIELSADRLQTKSREDYRRNHPFDLSEIKDLPRAINQPIAVFDSTKKDGSKVILTELQHDGSNFVAVVRVRRSDDIRRIDVEVNDIRSIYPKDHVKGVIDWFNSEDELLRWVDKPKAIRFISTQSTNLIAGGNEANSDRQVRSLSKR